MVVPVSAICPRTSPSLREIAALFLRLGTTAFGGPAAHIAMMEDEVVTRRGWLSRDAFLDYLGATNLVPGPNSTELAIHIGLSRHGWRGLVVAGTCFIVPATLIVTAIASAYVRFGTLPAVVAMFGGVIPVVLAIIAQALWKLGRAAVKSTALAAIAALSIAMLAAGANELLVLAGAGLISGAWTTRRLGRVALSLVGASSGRATVTATVGAAVTAAVVPFSLWTLFATFAKIGSVLFGSGYVLVAFLRADFVERLGWITERQLLDAIAVGQVTPGPVSTTATFVGYLVGGLPGAVVATVGIFLPAFVFVALSGPFVPRIRESAVAGAVLDGVNVASLALMVVVTWQLGRRTLTSPLPILMFGGALVALVRDRVNATWAVAAGALIGIALSLVRG